MSYSTATTRGRSELTASRRPRRYAVEVAQGTVFVYKGYKWPTDANLCAYGFTV